MCPPILQLWYTQAIFHPVLVETVHVLLHHFFRVMTRLLIKGYWGAIHERYGNYTHYTEGETHLEGWQISTWHFRKIGGHYHHNSKHLSVAKSACWGFAMFPSCRELWVLVGAVTAELVASACSRAYNLVSLFPSCREIIKSFMFMANKAPSAHRQSRTIFFPKCLLIWKSIKRCFS